MDEERQLIEAMVRKGMGLDKDNLEAVRTLKRVLTIPSNIFVMFDESFYQHLCLTSHGFEAMFVLHLLLCLRCNKRSKVFGNKPNCVLYHETNKKIEFETQFL